MVKTFLLKSFVVNYLLKALTLAILIISLVLTVKKMYEAKLAVVYILIAASACVRCSGWYWSNLRSHRPIHHDVPVRNCDTENKDTLAEIKSEIQNLQQLVAGLRGKVDPDLKLLHPRKLNKIVLVSWLKLTVVQNRIFISSSSS